MRLWERDNKFVIAVAALLVFTFTCLSWPVIDNGGRENLRGTIEVDGNVAAYPGLAGISLTQAGDVAATIVRGDIISIELEDEAGFLVYRVGIVAPGKRVVQLMLDAGTGKLLQTKFGERG